MKVKSFPSWTIDLLRLLVAFTLLFSGFVKGVDPMGGAIKISEYWVAFSWRSLSFLSYSLSVLLSSFEFLLGGILLMGFFKRLTTMLNLLFMSVMTLITIYLFIYNPISDCGCFGDAIKLTNGETLLKNIVLLTISIVLFRNHQRIHPIVSSHYATYALISLMVVGWGIFVYSNAQHLPMIDFRPYKIGKSIRDLVIPPPDAPQPVIEYDFIYEKEGKQAVFRLDSLPLDSEWSYVDRIERVISEGYVPEITDFFIYRQGEDVTNYILTEPGNMIWVLSPNWSLASSASAEKINALYRWAQMHNSNLYGISGSTNDEQGRWRNKTNAAYPLLFMDPITIKTIARSNPSVLFIQDGVIVGKINAMDLPKEDELDSFISSVFRQKLLQGKVFVERWFVMFIWIILSLVLFILTIGGTLESPFERLLHKEKSRI